MHYIFFYLSNVIRPRLVLKPNCIKVPKEVCVEAKVDPRKVRRTLVGERRTHHLKTKQAPELEDALGETGTQTGDTGDTALTG